MDIYKMIKCIVAIGVLIGGIDYLLGKKRSFGMKFENGFAMAGQMILSMAGIMSIAPVLASLLKPLLLPLCRTFHIDPSILGILLSVDMGGYHLAISMAEDTRIALMMGLMTASMFGGTLIFTIPVSAGLIHTDKLQAFNRGLLYGIMALPIGSILGGILLQIPIWEVVRNNIPVILLSALVIWGFQKHPALTLRILDRMGKVLSGIGLLGIIIGFISYLTGVNFIPEFIPIMESMGIVCGVIIFLVGILPIVDILTRICRKPLQYIGKRYGFTVTDTSGLLLTAASSVPVFVTVDNMSERGAVINGAWTVAISGIFGSQLSFVMSIAAESIVPFVISKVVCGLIALSIAIYCTKGF